MYKTRSKILPTSRQKLQDQILKVTNSLSGHRILKGQLLPGLQITQSDMKKLMNNKKPYATKILSGTKSSKDISHLQDKAHKVKFKPPLPFPLDLNLLKKHHQTTDQLGLPPLKESPFQDRFLSVLSIATPKKLKAISSGSYTQRQHLGVPTGRQQIKNLQKWFALMKKEYLSEFQQGKMNLELAEVIIGTCSKELIRQVSVECLERGNLLKKIMKMLKMMMDNQKEVHKKQLLEKEKQMEKMKNSLIEQINQQKEKHKNYKNALKEKFRMLQENNQELKEQQQHYRKQAQTWVNKYVEQEALWKTKFFKLLKQNFTKENDSNIARAAVTKILLRQEPAKEQTSQGRKSLPFRLPIDKKRSRTVVIKKQEPKNVKSLQQDFNQYLKEEDQQVENEKQEQKQLQKIQGNLSGVQNLEGQKIEEENSHHFNGERNENRGIQQRVQKVYFKQRPKKEQTIKQERPLKNLISYGDYRRRNLRQMMKKRLGEQQKIQQESEQSEQELSIGVSLSQQNSIENPFEKIAQYSSPFISQQTQALKIPNNQNKVENYILNTIETDNQVLVPKNAQFSPVREKQISHYQIKVNQVSEQQTNKIQLNKKKKKSKKLNNLQTSFEIELSNTAKFHSQTLPKNFYDVSPILSPKSIKETFKNISEQSPQTLQFPTFQSPLASIENSSIQIQPISTQFTPIQVNSIQINPQVVQKSEKIASFLSKQWKSRTPNYDYLSQTSNLSFKSLTLKLNKSIQNHQQTPEQVQMNKRIIQKTKQIEKLDHLIKEKQHFFLKYIQHRMKQKQAQDLIPKQEEIQKKFCSQPQRKISAQDGQVPQKMRSIYLLGEHILKYLPENMDKQTWKTGFATGHELGKKQGFTQGQELGYSKGIQQGQLLKQAYSLPQEEQVEQSGVFSLKRAYTKLDISYEEIQKEQEDKQDEFGNSAVESVNSDQNFFFKKKLGRKQTTQSLRSAEKLIKQKLREITKIIGFRFNKQQPLQKKPSPAPKILQKFFSKGVKSIIKNAFMTRKMVNKLISQIYNTCITKHKTGEMEQFLLQEIYNDFFQKYGFKNLCDKKFLQFISSVIKYSNYRRPLMFLKFLRISEVVNQKSFRDSSFSFYLQTLHAVQNSKIGIIIHFDDTADLQFIPKLRAIDCIRQRIDVFPRRAVSLLISQIDKQAVEDPKRINLSGLVELEYFLEKVIEEYENILSIGSNGTPRMSIPQ